MTEEGDDIRILHVDDDREFTRATADELGGDGIDIDVATTVADGLRSLDDSTYDCIVADYNLPERDGIAFLEAVRNVDPDLPFVLCTATGDTDVLSAAISVGVTDYVRKRTTSGASGDDPSASSGGTPAAIPELADAVSEAVDTQQGVTDATTGRVRAMDEAPVGITLSDPSRADNPLVYVNERFEEMTGYSGEEVLGRNCRLLQGERTRDEPVTELRDAVNGTEPVTVTLRNYRKDGTEFWNRVTIAPIRNDDGSVRNWVGFQEDITEQKESETELARATDRFETIFDCTNDAILIFDPDADRILEANPQAKSLLGYRREELLSLGPSDIHPHELDRFREFLETVRSGNGGWTDRLTCVTSAGEYVPVEISASTIEFDGHDSILAMIRDVSDRQVYEQELERKNERLERFVSVVAHDLRNPLNVAQLNLELLREDGDDESLESVAGALDRMETLLEDLLTLARSSDRVTDTELVDLSETITRCWANVDTELATLENKTERTIAADPGQLQQLIENLVRNAVEHGSTSPDSQANRDAVEEDSTNPATRTSPETEESATVTVTVGDLPGGFYVEDDGPGIPDDERLDVFEEGYTTAIDGTGFGLAIVREVATAHDWEISVTESDTGGARFEITGVESR